ncbi:MAG TPA: hypothetical protein VGI81_05335 [Tepidisphaeraceae bacterium]
MTRPSGRALLIGNAVARPQVAEGLVRLGYTCGEADDPYTGMAELCRRPLAYHAVILSLASLYREELPMIRAIKRRFPHLEVWLAHTDGRPAALAEAMRLGADGLLDAEGLHRIALEGMAVDEAGPPSRTAAPILSEPVRLAPPPPAADPRGLAHVADELEPEPVANEPLLSAEELKALLQEQPSMPQAGEDDS